MNITRYCIYWVLLIVTAFMGSCGSHEQYIPTEDVHEVQDLLRNGQLKEALQLIRQHMSEAKDSDTYYLWLVEQNRAWYTEMNVDSMSRCSEQILHYLNQHKDDDNKARQRLRAEWLKARGVFFTAIMGRPDSGLVYTERALEQMDGLEGVDELRILALANRADFYRQLGQLDRSADGYMKALETADSSGLGDEMKIPLMLGISTAYTFMGDYQNSGQWWENTGKLVNQMNTSDQFIYYNNLGNDHYFQQHYSEALQCFIKAAKLVKGDERKKWDYYTALGNMGEIYTCLGKADSARVMIQQADSFFRKVNFPPLLYYLETEKIELALLEGRTAEALHMVQHCEFKDVSIPAAKVLRLKAVEQLMQKTGNYAVAYETHQQLHAMNDSIQSANIKMQMSARLMQYEHDKRLIEQQQAIDHERLSSRLAWALFAISLLAVAIMIGLIQLRRRRQYLNDLTTRQQIISLRMENIRNRITPHFIYNALNHEMLAQMEGHEVDFSAITNLLRHGLEQADALQTTLAEELKFVDYYIEIEERQMSGEFNYQKDIAPDVDISCIHLPAMTIQIFVENAIKHGLRRQGGTLIIRACRKEKSTLVEVIDNGEGLKAGKLQEHTGMRVVRQTIQMLNEHNLEQVTFGINNLPEQKGCRAWILLPDDYQYQLT